MTKQSLVQRLGETDQAYLIENSPELALERAEIRLSLLRYSRHRQEQEYLLTQAVVILEDARLHFEEMPLSLYIGLSAVLGEAYLAYFSVTGETRYALISEQIARPLAHHDLPEIYRVLVQATTAQGKLALARHWQKKLHHSERHHAKVLSDTHQ